MRDAGQPNCYHAPTQELDSAQTRGPAARRRGPYPLGYPTRLLAPSLSLLALFALGASACGSDNIHDCNDGTDNDGDGLIDSADPGCERNGDKESPDPLEPIDVEPKSACSDGIDNDGDGLIDYPNDPGCRLTLQDSEEDDCPDGEHCPECSNGIDDDGDGFIDYPDDVGCQSAADTSEKSGLEPVCDGGLKDFEIGVPVTGVLEPEMSNNLISKNCGGLGPEFGYELVVSEPSALLITTDFPETSADTIIYVQSTCGDPESELGCNDDHGDGNASRLLLERVEPGTYVLVVDSHQVGSGDFKLEVTRFIPQAGACVVSASECGPGFVCRPDGGADSGTCEIPNGPTCTEDGILREKVVPQAGDLEITEWMPNTSAVSSFNGRWFEVKANAAVDVAGLQVGRASAASGPGTVLMTLDPDDCQPFAANSFLLFARQTDSSINGGLPPVDYVFTFFLSTFSDGIFIGMDDSPLDVVTYSSTTAGVSASKDPSNGSVCPGVTSYGNGDLGTPKAPNPSCP